MANEVVKYHNDLNTVSMRKWTASEMNLFFCIISKLRNKKSDLVELHKEDLIELSAYAGKNNERFVDTLSRLIEHVNEIKYKKFEHDNGFNRLRIMCLFDSFDFCWKDDFSEINGKIRVSKEFIYILNNFNINFTVFEKSEFMKLKSTYSKQLYRQLKQYRTVGSRKFKMEEFRFLLSIPDSYRIRDIDRRVIDISMSELKPLFKDLRCIKIKSRKKGNPVVAYQFTWIPEKTNKWIEGKPQSNPNHAAADLEFPDWWKNFDPEEASDELKEVVRKLEMKLEDENKLEF